MFYNADKKNLELLGTTHMGKLETEGIHTDIFLDFS